MAEALLANCGVSLSEVDAFAVAHGRARLPACASALRQSRVSRSAQTGRASAYRRSRPWPGARALSAAAVLRHGRPRGQVYNALFEVDGLMPRRLCDDRALKMTELSEEIGEATYFLVGDGANLCYNTIKDSCTVCVLRRRAALRHRLRCRGRALPLIREGRTCTRRSSTPSICAVRRPNANA